MSFTKSYEPGDFEPRIYAEWERTGAFQPKKPLIDSSESDSSNCFSIVMPPPNANGNLHIGHGLTIALEDSLTRYYRLRGDSAWYIPGADHAGFETWVVYERALEKDGHSRFEFSRDELYSRVWNFVEEQRGNMELQVRALGASCAWPDLTFTLDENVVSRVYKTFEKMWNDGMIYRGEKLVNFCPKHQTAFADIEVEHEDETGHLWDIAYEIVSTPDSLTNNSRCPESNPAHDKATSAEASSKTKAVDDDSEKSLISNSAASSRETKRAVTLTAKSDRPVRTGANAGLSKDNGEVAVNNFSEIIISTTRPETLFGDVAIAVNPSDSRYTDLIGGLVKLPLTDRLIPIIADEHADPTYGTGAVKITPAHDFDDFEVGERHNLERIQVIGEDGKMLAAAGPDYEGLTTAECRQKVLHDLEEQGLLRGEKEITHSVAHCYKCGTVIEPTLKSQWFIDVKRLAEMAIKHLEAGEIKFHPANKKKVLINYLQGLKDWNISRQIPWGIAIPMFHQTETDKAPEWIFDTRTNLTKIEVGGVNYYRDEDTFDTWFSSSHWPIVCTDWLEGADNPYYPLSVMETGADILFAWVARMIMMGVYVTGEVPFKEVYLHGLVLDAHGKKMSKSKGNVINPIDLVTKYGSDAFRLGILRGRSAGMNQAFSENSVISGRNLCNKLWNIARFIQSIVDDSSKTTSGKSQSSPVDEHLVGADSYAIASPASSREREARATERDTRKDGLSSGMPRGALRDELTHEYTTNNMGEDWICHELTACKEEIEDDFKCYRFSEAVETLYTTIWDKYADWFIESQKIYKNVPLLKTTLEMLLKMLHPFAPFVTEAIWQSLSWTDGLLITSKWPSRLQYDPISAQQFETLMSIVVEIRATVQALPAPSNGQKWTLLYGEDAIVDDNQLLTAKLSGVASVISCGGQPRGLRLALANHELYLDVPADIVAKHRHNLEERILAVGRELDTLNARMLNPSYVDKAPAHLVEQTRNAISEKSALIDRLKRELEVIQ